MSQMFEYARKGKMDSLSPDQQRFVAMMIVKDIKKYAKTHDVSEETVYSLWQKGMLGADRSLD